MKKLLIAMLSIILIASACSEKKKEESSFLDPKPIDLFGEKITSKQINEFQTAARLKFPEGTKFLVFRYEPAFQDDASYMKISVPKEKLSDLIANSPFKNVDLETEDQYGCPTEGLKNWDIEKVKIFRSGRAELRKNAEYITIVIDDSTNDNIIVYLSWFEI